MHAQRSEGVFRLPNGVDLSRFQDTKPRPPEYADLAGRAYLQHAAMGLIPFVVSPLTDSINPLKMYEYLACGLPTICSPLKEVQAMGAPVLFADDVGSYLSSIDQTLAATDEVSQSHRRYAAQHTWERRYEKVDAILDRLLT